MPTERTPRRLSTPLQGALGALGAVLGCAEAPTAPPNVVLAVLDTVRADHLSCYGYELPTTPTMDALAERAERYTDCRATSPWTLPSHASMFTGLYPFQHGAQARLDPRSGKVGEYPLAPESRTLAEALKDEGYRTAGVAANGGYLAAALGFAQGFDHYDVKVSRSGPRRGPDVNRLAFEWLDQGERDAPFFLFLNYMDAHRPYNVTPLPPERAAGLPPPDPQQPQTLLNELVQAVLETDEPPSAELVRRVVTQYDVGLANADLAIEGLIAGLKERGLWERTLFIVTSDHGEYFGEHDLVEHSKDVYEEALHVPLIVRRPGSSRGTVIERRTTIAAIPHIVALALSGESAARLKRQFPDPGTDVTFAELRYTRSKDLGRPYGARFMRERTVVYSGPYKAILSTDEQHELYDLTLDPLEQHNLIAEPEHEEAAAALLDLARDERARGEDAGPAGPPFQPSAEHLETLRNLGYMDGEGE